MDEALKELDKGRVLMAKGEEAKAYKCFDKATQLDGMLAEAFFLKAEAGALVSKIDIPDVSAAYAKACELEGTNAHYLSTFGAFLLDTAQWSKAEEMYNKAAEADADNPGWYYQEFGYEYFQAMQRHYEGELSAAMLREVRKKAALYMLRALALEPGDVKELFGA